MMPAKEDFIREITFKTSRSGGKGGQHVNKVSTKVELIFSLHDSLLFSEEEKLRLREKLCGKLDLEGKLHVVSQEARSQLANKERAVEKALLLLNRALQVRVSRKATKVPKSAVEKRLTGKLALAVKKENRRRPSVD
ncbi:RF-1 domain protein [compost metagenome]